MTLPNNDEDDDAPGVGLADFLDGEIVQIAGAAADAAGVDPSLSRFPRLARLALLEALDPHEAHKRLCADLGELDADLGERAGVISPNFDPDGALALAAELDREAATRDHPDLRSYADGLRLQALPVNVKARERRWVMRIAQALTDCVHSVRALDNKTDAERRRLAELQVLGIGWCALAAGCRQDHARWGSRAFDSAARLGALLTSAIGQVAVAGLRAKAADRDDGRDERRQRPRGVQQAAAIEVPPGHVVIARLGAENKRARTRELTGGLEAVLDLQMLRSELVAWYPQAVEVVDTLLDDLRGRDSVKLRPTLLIGPAGAGKSSFAALLARALGTGFWRADATQDAAVIAGDEQALEQRRAEPLPAGDRPSRRGESDRPPRRDREGADAHRQWEALGSAPRSPGADGRRRHTRTRACRSRPISAMSA